LKLRHLGAYDQRSVPAKPAKEEVIDDRLHYAGLCGSRAPSQMPRPTSTSYTRRAWDDRYNQPTVDQLRQGLDSDTGKLFDALREFLRDLKDVSETTVWYGECWRWTVEYRLAERAEPLALLIPSPEDLQLALPINPDFTEALPSRPLKRAVREGLELGLEPFDTRWGVWSISYPKLVDELASLIEVKLLIATGNDKTTSRAKS
jgi:hypothetical protein